VNGGVRPLKPPIGNLGAPVILAVSKNLQYDLFRNSQLKESSSLLFVIRRHDIDQILDGPTLKIVAVISLDDGFQS
jgi:hypothetical protein